MSTKLHKFSAFEAEWKAEGGNELAVSPASLIMHIFDSQKLVSTDAILCATICQAQEESRTLVSDNLLGAGRNELNTYAAFFRKLQH